MIAVSSNNTLQTLHGTIALAGAGKMGGAMLQGWLALGLDPRKIAVVEPRPADEIAALAARGVRVNGAVEDASVIVIAIKPQDAATVNAATAAIDCRTRRIDDIRSSIRLAVAR